MAFQCVRRDSADVQIKQEHSQTFESDYVVDLTTLSRDALRELARGGSFEASVRLSELEAQDRAADPRRFSREQLRIMAAQGSPEARILLEELRAKGRASYYQRKARIAAGIPTTVASYERQRLNGKKRLEKKRKPGQVNLGQVVTAEPEKVDAMQPVVVPMSEQDLRGLENAAKLFEEVEEPEYIEIERWSKEFEECGETREPPAALPPGRSDRELCLSIWEALGS